MYSRRNLIVRLACMKHAASVRPEPGSNSPLSEELCPSFRDSCLVSRESYETARLFVVRSFFAELTSFLSSFTFAYQMCHYSIVKVQQK